MEKKIPSRLLSAFWPGLIVALIIAVSLSGIMDHDLWTPDEPREAAIALGMSQSGNLIVPELAGQPFVEKPPLFYIVASFFLLGLGEIIGNTAALRLVLACFGLGTLLFTYLLGKIYFDRQKALITAGILATMIGFAHVTHWLLVDNALMFFITASVWALAKAYENNRLSYLPLAGILVAFAFLTKGLIGPIIIGLAWLGIFIPWVYQLGHRQIKTLRPCPGFAEASSGQAVAGLDETGPGSSRFTEPVTQDKPPPATTLSTVGGSACGGKFFAYHALALIAFGLISSIWIIAFALKGGPELFHEWWWTNHFGRFTGAANHLGHISPWYYYFSVLPVYLLLWIVPFIAAIIIFFKKSFRAEKIPAGLLLFIFWTLGSLLILSLSATKRDIYLSALLPACALLCIYGLEAGGRTAKIGERIYWFWMFLLFIVLAAFIAAPLVGSEFFGFSFISFTFGWRHILALATVLISALVILRLPAPFLQRFLIAAMICYSTLFIIICPVIDSYKSYGTAFRSTADAIRSRPELKVAGWNLDETTVAGFYYYCGLVFPSISDQKMLDDILQGQNLQFNGALTLEKNVSPNDLPDKENQVIFKSRMGKRRLLQLIVAADHKNRQ